MALSGFNVERIFWGLLGSGALCRALRILFPLVVKPRDL